MTNIRPAKATDVNMFINLNEKFIREYKASGENTYKAKRKEIKRKFARQLDQTYMITDNGSTVGYVNLMKYYNNITNEYDYFIYTMYIYPGFRGKGLAKSVRQQLLAQGVKGTVISYGRVSRNIDYFVDCGFTHITEYPEQVGSDKGLCLLVVEENVGTKPLTTLGVEHSRKDAWIKSEQYARQTA